MVCESELSEGTAPKKYNANHTREYKFPSSHIRARENKQVTLILIILYVI